MFLSYTVGDLNRGVFWLVGSEIIEVSPDFESYYCIYILMVDSLIWSLFFFSIDHLLISEIESSTSTLTLDYYMLPAGKNLLIGFSPLFSFDIFSAF